MEISIHTIDARDNVFLEIIKKKFGLSPSAMLAAIQNFFNETVSVLETKGIKYTELRGALAPGTDRKEMVLVFDRTKISNSFYGMEVYKRVLPAISLYCLDSSHCVLHGDYLAVTGHEVKQKSDLFSKIVQCNTTNYVRPNQYFLVYINNLTKHMLAGINKSLMLYDAYIGYADTSTFSRFKSYLSTTLPQSFIWFRKTALMAHEDDRPNSEDVNTQCLPEEGLKIRSIQSLYYGVFLSYKIQRPVLSLLEVDNLISLNAISDKPVSLLNFDVRLEESKLQYLLTNKRESLERLGLANSDTKKISALIKNRLNSGYLYNLRIIEPNGKKVMLFNIQLEVFNKKMNKVNKAMAAFEYQPENNLLKITTLY